jgi:hypothetical protein
VDVGPKIGERIPSFHAPDHHGTETIRVQWHFDLIPPDLVRAPEALQHKAKARQGCTL